MHLVHIIEQNRIPNHTWDKFFWFNPDYLTVHNFDIKCNLPIYINPNGDDVLRFIDYFIADLTKPEKGKDYHGNCKPNANLKNRFPKDPITFPNGMTTETFVLSEVGVSVNNNLTKGRSNIEIKFTRSSNPGDVISLNLHLIPDSNRSYESAKRQLTSHIQTFRNEVLAKAFYLLQTNADNFTERGYEVVNNQESRNALRRHQQAKARARARARANHSYNIS